MTRDLAPHLRSLLRPYTGVVTSFQQPAGGNDSDLTAFVESEHGPFFIKAMRNKPGGRRDSIIRERLINPYVHPLSPAMRWHAEDSEWIALGFDIVAGRRADFAPGSKDLTVVVELLDRIGGLDLPDVAQEWTERRWDRFCADESEAELLRGDALLYTDIHESNLIVGRQNVWAVDWSWPTKGAAFIDPAQFAVQLVSAGHSPESAELWAGRCKAWANANPASIDAFSAATVRMWRVRCDRSPDATWLEAMLAAAERWADHRGVDV
ncbi:protein kinase [Streptomyces rimosus]|uniref:hypothetical protein n=1 Tax=Streptomyces rimosus TaxID=1927 RepID=UPI0004CA3072|nr:hypothetical protein [Streptomyces rimosus]